MKVCMMLYNPFTNDARVYREATALTKAGYEVMVLAVQSNDESLPAKEWIDYIEVIRIKRSVLPAFRMVLALILILIFIWTHFLIGMLVLILLLLLKRKVYQLMSVVQVIILMVYKGLKARADVYHAHDLNTLFQGIICAKLRRKKIIYDSHEVQISRNGYHPLFTLMIERSLVRFADCIIMTTKTRGDYFEHIYKRKPYIISNYAEFIDYDEVIPFDFYTQYQLNHETKILLYQGGIQKGRGLGELVKAMQEVEGAHLFIIGPSFKGEKERLLELIKEANLHAKITFIDKVPYKDLLSYTKSAYIGFQLLQPINFNHMSALSNKLFEYMMMHVPIIACDLIEIQEVIKEAGVGLTVDSCNSLEIAKAINHLLNNSERHAHFTKQCKIAKYLYNWDHEKQKLIQIYSDLQG